MTTESVRNRFPGREFLSTAEYADAVGLAVSTVRRAVRNGDIPARRIGGSWRIPISDLEVHNSQGESS